MIRVPIACQSEGALEVYVEPVLPSPHLVVIGRSPAVDALARMAHALGWRTAVVDDGGNAEEHDAPTVVTALDMDAAGVGPGSFVVVATQGHYDEDALARALETPAGYVGLVASRKRADVGARVPARPRRVGRRDRTRPRAGRARPRAHPEPGDRGRDPRRARAAARRGTARAAAGSRGAARGDRPGLRHDGRRRDRALSDDPRGPHLLLLLRGVPGAVHAGPCAVPRRPREPDRMQIENTFTVAQPAETLWSTLLDVEKIVPCMPGAELTEVVDDTHWKGKLNAKFGPVAMSFAGTVDDGRSRRRRAPGGAPRQGHGAEGQGRGGRERDVVARDRPVRRRDHRAHAGRHHAVGRRRADVSRVCCPRSRRS